ncbi:ARMT1-like domain-containing protein [Desulfospira joergensenii]|uniref:ARMT1-like domain-containing protein n=1 Tax=Desulfospira joergensenii TaxID=53329 RepID=UPI0003B35929|nr:ARMT1-like domain-containing protein [Desulfospira joergensenii]
MDLKMTKNNSKPAQTPADPDRDAWFTAFFLENHIDPFAYPNKVGTPEQTEFMVYPENNQAYYPCSDKTFETIMSRKKNKFLKDLYKKAYDKVMGLVDEFIEQEYDRLFLKSLINIKYEHEIQSGLIIPSRLEKRLYKIFLSRTHIEDPYSREKQHKNKQAARLLESETFKKALNRIDGSFSDMNKYSLEDLRKKIKEIEFRRLLSLYSAADLWENKKLQIPSLETFKDIFCTDIKGNGLEALLELIHARKNKILWLTDEAGSVLVDIRIAKFLAELGHTVILAVKEGSFFKKVSLTDTRTDPVLVKELESAHFIYEKAISKNKLVQRLKQDANIYVVSDGTSENLNLLLASTTFARIFKEADVIISRGSDQEYRLILTRFQFTRDIINISSRDNTLSVTHKPRHPDFINFSHQELEEKANAIIDQMKAAKAKNMTVMFYSGIIGSIPGKIDVAKKIMTLFIDYLHQQSADLFIINPSLYYEPGMDADDLMYMWEIVQRSRFIDIWRFQTADDIAQSFILMKQKIPPEWIGKDSTYSTGCTKEMKIAWEVQRANPEMQLIGPPLDRFMRRDEYGVGSMYDQRLAGE